MFYNPDVQLSTQKAFAEALLKLSGKFRNTVFLHGNVASIAGVQGFAKAYPERHFNFGNGIGHMLGAATGFTIRGKIPFVCSLAVPVSGKSWDEIRNYICHPNLNVKIVGIDAGILNGQDGATHQALEDIAIMRALPNMKVVCPADAVETRRALEMMMLDYGPTYLRLYNLPLPELYDDSYSFHFGKSHIYKAGSDVCIFALGTAVHTSLEAAKLLDARGFSTMVVNMSSVKPLDEDLVAECAKQIPHLVTVEDHNIVGGLGSAVAETLSARYPAKLLRIGMTGFGESGKVDDLYKKYRLDAAGIAEQVGEWVGVCAEIFA